MTKSGSNEALKQVVALEPESPRSRVHEATQLLTAVSLFFVVMTPVAYFAGRAYHDGWYDALHLDQGMFPLDTAGMMTEGFVAAGDAAAKLAKAAVAAILAHWFLLIVIILAGGLIGACFRWINHRVSESIAKQTKKASDDHDGKKRGLAFLTITPTIVLLLIGLVLYELVFGFILGYTILTQPFYQLGKYEAKQASANDFKQSPIVTVKSDKGDVARREIGCGPQFCALWGEGHASFAPVSDITWGDAPPPGP